MRLALVDSMVIECVHRKAAYQLASGNTVLKSMNDSPCVNPTLVLAAERGLHQTNPTISWELDIRGSAIAHTLCKVLRYSSVQIFLAGWKGRIWR